MSYSAFVVDDEPKARINLVDALSRHQSWDNIKTFASGKTLLNDVSIFGPDVVFLDIQMPGEDGITLAKKLLTLEMPPLIVFVTAFSNYAVTAFELYALDFLLKPFDNARVDTCVERLSQVLANSQTIKETRSAQDAWAKQKPIDKVIIRSATTLRIIPVDHILWIAANGNYVDIHHQEGKHLLRGSLKSLVNSLPATKFIQIHRGHLVRKDLLRELRSEDEDKYSVLLSNGDVLPVGNAYRADLINAIIAH